MTDWDIALVEGPDGQVCVHLANCQEVRALADKGHPVATLIGCASLPEDLNFARCLRDAIVTGRAGGTSAKGSHGTHPQRTRRPGR
jgi:hypothetical protein